MQMAKKRKDKAARTTKNTKRRRSDPTGFDRDGLHDDRLFER